MDRTEFNSLLQKAKDAGLHGVGLALIKSLFYPPNFNDMKR